MLVLHANWTKEGLFLWGESSEAYAQMRVGGMSLYESAAGGAQVAVQATVHPFAASADALRESLGTLIGAETSSLARTAECQLQLPVDERGVQASDSMKGAMGGEDEGSGGLLERVTIPGLMVETRNVPSVLTALSEGTSDIELAPSVQYWGAVLDFSLELLENQRFVPSASPQRTGAVNTSWSAWLDDEDVRARAQKLVDAMPAVCRAVVQGANDAPGALLEDAIMAMADVVVREALIAEQFDEAIADADEADPHVGLLSGLLRERSECSVNESQGLVIARGVGQWVARLDTGRDSRTGRLCLRLEEPLIDSRAQSGLIAVKDGWKLTFHMQSTEDESRLVAAEDIWSGAANITLVSGTGHEQGTELLLAELTRAARIYPKLEQSLREASPAALSLTTGEAHEFLKDFAAVLEEAGIGVILPDWWQENRLAIGLRLIVDAKEEMPGTAGLGVGNAGNVPPLGLQTLINYKWQVAVGDRVLTREDIAAMKAAGATLINIGGQWVEIQRENLDAAAKHLQRGDEGEMTLLSALQTAYGQSDQKTGLNILGLDARGWIAQFLGTSTDGLRMQSLIQPDTFVGELRAYQQKGLSWLAFLDSLGFGACLADDMGLGKTIQLIAMLLYERERRTAHAQNGASKTSEHKESPALSLDPTLLIVPTSVVVNWVRELQRFAPSLTVHVHHGPERPTGQHFAKAVENKDVCITTYPLVSRDADALRSVRWRRVVLDEAQYIKNPPTKQATAIRSLNTTGRIALTGTPVENRLSELWSIMEFCNPGYLGNPTEFRRRFALPIERHRDQRRTQSLKHLVRPFVLRRLKSDPTVIDDLPDCLETKEFATLTPEQAGLYEEVVRTLIQRVEQTDGIQRRGMVLAALVRLKQICDHPDLMISATANASAVLGDGGDMIVDADESHIVRTDAIAALSSRSGKAQRLMVLLDEVLASDGRALVFTQFRQMGHLLAAMLQRELGREALFLHGGTPSAKRQAMIDRFQSASGECPVFILSLRAGGLGLNLTAANHVFHYDRWWNPAVEAQATDRAYRIGQTRTVHVHKFVCAGTLEERIDQMIEQKTELARNIIGSGEQWLTELSTGQLRDLLMLRQTALEGES
ncbi:MAG TPA: DEAD/DEAH box helicase [Phycisphaerales bacterium]|nr:DEAD/DEAH box helicase [Phycisphaerales bacterium]